MGLSRAVMGHLRFEEDSIQLEVSLYSHQLALDYVVVELLAQTL